MNIIHVLNAIMKKDYEKDNENKIENQFVKCYNGTIDNY